MNSKPLDRFRAIVEEAGAMYADNALFRKLDAGTFQMSDYHALLLALFHQVSESASSFALAAANLDFGRQWAAKSYLFKHAEEEKLHWKWIVDDLKNTGYAGPDPVSQMPSVEATAYIAFNFFAASRAPITRLAIAAVLESISPRFGRIYAGKAAAQLKLKANQMVFFVGHADADVGHVQEVFDVIAASGLTDSEWQAMEHAARTAGYLYRNIYERAGKR